MAFKWFKCLLYALFDQLRFSAAFSTKSFMCERLVSKIVKFSKERFITASLINLIVPLYPDKVFTEMFLDFFSMAKSKALEKSKFLFSASISGTDGFHPSFNF